MFQSKGAIGRTAEKSSPRRYTLSEADRACREIERRLTARFPACPSLSALPRPDTSSCPGILKLINDREAKVPPPVDNPPLAEIESPKVDRLKLLRAFISEMIDGLRTHRQGWKPLEGLEIVYFEVDISKPLTFGSSETKGGENKLEGECPRAGIPLIDYLSSKSAPDLYDSVSPAIFETRKLR